MRRNEFECIDSELMESMLEKIEFGVIIIPDIEPYGVPVSFCYCENEIYLHGAKNGRKYHLLKENPKVSFTATKVYSYIPSTFLNNTMIPTQFFFSIYLSGIFKTITEVQRKKHILKTLVQKYEPSHQSLNMDLGQFEGQEKGVFVGTIEIISKSIKAKFGQNLKANAREQIIKDLEKRGTELDKNTIKMIRHFNS
ncbi:pyridoxamine 5'-phosphate oxidase family protein [Helicobacter winghamensis]|uniref:pyridoxamine 5'-phosphate oxidase family protein n=1 Tax=Helicobacter winghamensis TaxID=157268 RepID=UPI0018A3FC6B|nr:pyridoxamine 5'-phosphate oxidase family protein [Helicobacter winghamensis]QOQ98691.1 pyridoxamine 5'-phosphate oxidase family protein [Helicobacter winghamensis]